MAQNFTGTTMYITDAGLPVSGALIYTYEAGTLTLKAAFTTTVLDVPQTNPIVADANGMAQFVLGPGSYRIKVFRPGPGAELTQYASDYISADATTTDDNITVQQSGGTSRDLASRNADFQLLTDFGGILANGADQTSAITTWLGTLSSAAVGMYVVPYNCKYTDTTVIAAMPAGVAFLDLSGVNDFSAAAETTKVLGLLSKDKAESDTHWRIGSGHHAILNLNNYGNAGTTSASERKASLLWSAGKFALGDTTKRGFRGVAIDQFTKITGTTYWAQVLRSLAPWSAVNGNYEIFIADEAITAAGVYRSSGDNHYVSNAAGAAGASAPTHTSGTVGIWDYVDSADRTLRSFDQYGRFLIGGGADGPTFRQKVHPNDPGTGHYVGQIESTGISKNVIWRGTPTDGSGAAQVQPYLQWEDGYGMRVMKSDGSADLGSVTDSGWRVALEATTVVAPTVASASTIAVSAATPINFVSGTTAIVNITVPTLFASSGGEVVLIPTGLWTTTTAGNIALASTAVVGKRMTMTYDSGTNKWYPSY